MSKAQEELGLGVYGWFTCQEVPNHSLFFLTNEEDYESGKSEGTVHTNGDKKPVERGQFAIITGGIEGKDNGSVEKALRREIEEELGVTDISISEEELPQVVVHQDRPDEKGEIHSMRFLVSGRKIEIPWETLKELTERHSVKAIPDEQLLEALTQENTREATYAIVRRMARKLKRKRAST